MTISKDVGDDPIEFRKVLEAANTDQVVKFADGTFAKIVCPNLSNELKLSILNTSNKNDLRCFFCSGTSIVSKFEVDYPKGIFLYERYQFSATMSRYSGALWYGDDSRLSNFTVLLMPPMADELGKEHGTRISLRCKYPGYRMLDKKAPFERLNILSKIITLDDDGSYNSEPKTKAPDAEHSRCLLVAKNLELERTEPLNAVEIGGYSLRASVRPK